MYEYNALMNIMSITVSADKQYSKFHDFLLQETVLEDPDPAGTKGKFIEPVRLTVKRILDASLLPLRIIFEMSSIFTT